MEVLLANPRGFCAGVHRAIEVVEIALERFGAPVYVRHEIVHNRYVVEQLREKGAVFIEDPANVPPGSLLIFSAHGVSPAVREAAKARELRVVDATCPLVTKVHRETLRMVDQGCEIVLVGHAGHVEVEGTMGHAPEQMYLVQSIEDVEKLEVRDPRKLTCVTQTTLSVDDTRDILEALERRFPDIALPRKDDICYATQNRQSAVKELSNRLAELAAKAGIRSRLVQDASEIEPSWIEGARCVGVTAGASAPEILVLQVVERLKELADGAVEVNALPEVDEGIVFQLPPTLR
jgi:4-hydroxy-3-methylbut-2-enyl diphosphate reductase